jgi:two-component system phosphate regulon response regulator PhoB
MDLNTPGQAVPRRVLVVDDDPDMCNMLAHALRRSGFAVSVCGDAPAALRVTAEFRPHAFVLDVGLQGTDGLELCRKLRREPGLERAPVLIITGKFDVTELSDLRRRVRESGGDGVLLKPFRFTEVVARLNALLEAGAAGPEL